MRVTVSKQCCASIQVSTARDVQVHLFNVEVHNGPVLMEARSTAPGTQVLPAVLDPALYSLRIHWMQGDLGDLCPSLNTGSYKTQAVQCVLQLVACDSPAGRLGVTVCYDLRFPEMYQRLAFEQGAEVMLVPSAFTKATGGHIATLLLCTGLTHVSVYP